MDNIYNDTLSTMVHPDAEETIISRDKDMLNLVSNAQKIGFTIAKDSPSSLVEVDIQDLNNFIKENFSSYLSFNVEEQKYVKALLSFLMEQGADPNNIKDLRFIFDSSEDIVSILLEHGFSENKLFGAYLTVAWSYNDSPSQIKVNALVNEWFERKFLKKIPEFNLADGSKSLIDQDGKLLSSKLILAGDYDCADKLFSLFPFLKSKLSLEEQEKMFIFYAEQGRDLEEIYLRLDYSKQTLEFLVSKGLSIDKVISSHFDRLLYSYDSYEDKLEIAKWLNEWFEKNLLDKLPDFALEGVSKLLIDEDGNSLLHKFITANRIDLAEKLLYLLPSMNNIFNNNKLSPLELAYSLNNSDAIMLLLEFWPTNLTPENHCAAMLDRFDNEYYVAKNLPSVEKYNMDSFPEAEKLFIFIMGPNSAKLHDNTVFLKDALSSNIPSIVIGNGVELLSLDGIENIISQYKPLPLNIELVILGHGELAENSDNNSEIHHAIYLFNLRKAAKTFDIFEKLANIFDNKSLNLTFISCHGGAALHHDIHALPEGSKVTVFAKHANSVSVEDTKGLVFPITSNNPSETYMLDYLFGLREMNNIPGIGYSGKRSKFIDEDANFIGQEINKCKKDKIITTLDEVICKSNIECLKNIEEVMVKIENSQSIRDLMASEEISANAAKNKEPNIKDNEFTENSVCKEPEMQIDSMYLTNDARFCKFSILYYSNEGFAECLGFTEKEEPNFGVAQAVLYLLGTLEFQCVEIDI